MSWGVGEEVLVMRMVGVPGGCWCELRATWEVVRIQQSGFCQSPASRKFPRDE